MRIISDFHDYYDVIQGQGQDLGLRYIRKTSEVEVPEYPFYDARSRVRSWSKLSATRMVVGFCGKVYPIMRIYGGADANYEYLYCYSAGAVDEWVCNNLKAKDVRAYRAPVPKKYNWYKGNPAYARKNVEKFFTETADEIDAHKDLFVKFDAPIFLADGERITFRRRAIIEVNPCLRLVEFYKLIDPYTAFQELAMYLGAQAQPEKPIPPIPDKVMVGAKGFDKHSFRKDPGKRKPRRRK